MITGFTKSDSDVTFQEPSILASPESHIWEVKMSPTGGTTSSNILFNKKTGEIFTISYDGDEMRKPELKK